jgi:hypothetical protein
MSDLRHQIWDEVLDFLVAQPTPHQIIAFEGSEHFQARVRYLREVNQNGNLTDAERLEMEEIAELGQFMRQLKIRALEKVAALEKTPAL